MKRTAFLPADVSWHNWGSFFTETAVWQPVVARICRKSAVSPANQIQAGYPGSCAVFIVDKSVVVKIYPPHFAADFGRELAVYAAINGRLPHIPRLISNGIYQDQIDWPYLILNYCPGQPIRELHQQLTDLDRQRIGTQLAHLLRRLHAIPLPESMTLSAKAWTTFLQTNQERTLIHLQKNRLFSLALIAKLAAFLANSAPVWQAEAKRPLQLLNADLTDDHLLLDRLNDQWQISALIDWADATAGTSFYEWVPLWYGLCQQDKQLFAIILTTYDPTRQIDDTFGKNLLLYTCLHRFGGEIITHVLNQHGNPPVRTLTDLHAVLWLSTTNSG